VQGLLSSAGDLQLIVPNGIEVLSVASRIDGSLDLRGSLTFGAGDHQIGGNISVNGNLDLGSGSVVRAFGETATVTGDIHLESAILDAALAAGGRVFGRGLTGNILSGGGVQPQGQLAIAHAEVRGNMNVLSEGPWVLPAGGGITLAGGTLHASDGLDLDPSAIITGPGTIDGSIRGGRVAGPIAAPPESWTLTLGRADRADGVKMTGFNEFAYYRSIRLLDADRAQLGPTRFYSPFPSELLIDAPNGVQFAGVRFLSPQSGYDLKFTGPVYSGSSVFIYGGAQTPANVDAITFDCESFFLDYGGVTRLRGTPAEPAIVGKDAVILGPVLFADHGLWQRPGDLWTIESSTVVGNLTLDGTTQGGFAGGTIVVRGGLFGRGFLADTELFLDGATATSSPALGGIAMAPASLFSPGRENVAGILTLQGGGFKMLNDPVTIFDLAGSERGNGYDALISDGALTLDGLFAARLGSGFQPRLGDVFDFFDSVSLSGSFESVALPDLPQGLSWDVSRFYVDGSVSVVPEPTSTALLLASLALGVFRRPTRGGNRAPA
jgi:hypothetical protein